MIIAALTVAGVALTGSAFVLGMAGAVGVVLGAAAVRIVWGEVLASRRDAARDRATQARDYLALTEVRVAEQAIYVAETSGRLVRHAATIGRLEGRLADAAAEVAETHRALAAEREVARQVSVESERVRARLEEAEGRAAEAIVRVAELEQELDVVLGEWRAGQRAPLRKHA